MAVIGVDEAARTRTWRQQLVEKTGHAARCAGFGGVCVDDVGAFAAEKFEQFPDGNDVAR